MEKEQNKTVIKVRSLIVLQILLLLYSIGGIFSKLAGQSDFFSIRFFWLYGLVLLDMAVYAILWQQILTKIPLITAYANKAVTVIWGLIWGMIIFNETIIVQKLVGAVVIVAGIVMVVKSDE